MSRRACFPYLFLLLTLLCLTALPQAQGGSSPPPERPELLLQNGHSGPVRGVAFSPDGARLATVSEDESARVWEVATGRVQASFSSSPWEEDGAKYWNAINCVAFSPDRRSMAAGCSDTTIVVWDTLLNRQTRILKGHSDKVKAVAYSPGGKLIASGGDDKTVILWDGRTGGIRTRLTLTDRVNALAFSPDGKLLFTASESDSESLKVWNVESAALASSLPFERSALCIAVSPDGRTLAVGSGRGVVVLRECATGKELLALDEGSGQEIAALAFTPDGRTLVTASTVLTLWDAATGAKKKSIPAERGMLYALAVSPDGATIATGGSDENATLWDASTLTPIRSLAGRSSPIASMGFSSDGARMATGGQGGKVRLWDMTAGRICAVFPGLTGWTESAISADGRLVAGGDARGVVKIWDARTGKERVTLKGPERGGRESSIAMLTFGPDGRHLAVAGSASSDGKVYEVATGKLLATVKGGASSLSSIAVSPDGQTVATGSADGTVREWSIATRQIFMVRTAEYRRSARSVTALTYSHDGKYLAAGSKDGRVCVWENGYEEPPLIFDAPSSQHLYTVAFSPDGRHLAAGTYKCAVLWDVATRKVFHVIEAHSSNVTAVAFCRGGAILATGSADTSMKFFDAATGKHLATAMELEEGKDWVVTTPDGLFDGSPGGQKLIEWRIGDRIYALEQFFNDFYTPRLLPRLLLPTPPKADGTDGGARAGDSPRARLDIARLRPPPRITIVSPESGAELSADTVAVKVEMTDQGGGCSRPALFLNGHRTPGRPLETGGVVTFTARLVEGTNRLRVTAYNGDGSIESRGDEIGVICNAAPARKPRLYVFSVGIDNYERGLRLRYAVADAKALASLFRAGLYDEVKQRSLFDGDAKRAAILDALKAIEDDAAPQDTLIVSLAGHGTLVGDLFYFLPWDAAVQSDDDIRRTGLSSTELADALSRIAATRQVVILDACHSGATTTSLGRLLASRDAVGLIRAQQRLARSSGSFLIAASTAEQSAHEVAELGHGVLTYAILKGVGEQGAPGAAVNSEGQVTVNGLLRYLSDEVPKLTETHMGARQDVVQYSSGQDFPLAVVRK